MQNKIAAYLQDLVDIGVAGFRIDASKHIDTNEIAEILSRVEGEFYVFQEVIDQGGEPIQAEEYFQNGDVTEFKYSLGLANYFNPEGEMRLLSNLDYFASDFMPSDKGIVFTDNHDNQRSHGGGGDPVTYKDGIHYKLANVFMLAWPYGYPKVMSSYAFEEGEEDIGPPTYGEGTTKDVHNPDGTLNCFGDDWICEHRWESIGNMVEFHNVTASAFYVANWWDNGGDQIAFSRGDRGFVAINRGDFYLNETLPTGLPSGTYCNVFDGQLTAAGSNCSGSGVRVKANQEAVLSLPPLSAVAIHVDDMIPGSGSFASTYDHVFLRGTFNEWRTTGMTLIDDHTWQTTVMFSGALDDSFKFDIYGDWSLNFGDDDGDGIADQNGDNIPIDEGAADYTITFDDSTRTYTVVRDPIPVTFHVTNSPADSPGHNWSTPIPPNNENEGRLEEIESPEAKVYVVGNIPELGNEDPCEAVELPADVVWPSNSYDEIVPASHRPGWSGTVLLPPSTTIEYKYIKYTDCAHVTWEGEEDDWRSFTTPASGSVEHWDMWRSSSNSPLPTPAPGSQPIKHDSTGPVKGDRYPRYKSGR